MLDYMEILYSSLQGRGEHSTEPKQSFDTHGTIKITIKGMLTSKAQVYSAHDMIYKQSRKYRIIWLAIGG